MAQIVSYESGRIRKTESGQWEVISHPYTGWVSGRLFPAFKTLRAAKAFIERNPRSEWGQP